LHIAHNIVKKRPEQERPRSSKAARPLLFYKGADDIRALT